MEKIQGVKNFGNEGERRFCEILSCPPPKMRVAPQMPPKFRDLAPPLGLTPPNPPRKSAHDI